MTKFVGLILLGNFDVKKEKLKDLCHWNDNIAFESYYATIGHDH
jgi:hypothetical protein